MRIKPQPEAALRLLSNPAAFRIVSTLAARGNQTTDEIAAALDEIPQSTLYRHLSALRGAGIVNVVSEQQARGAVERTYALASPRTGGLNAEQVARVPIGQTRAAIRNFIASLAANVSAFIGSASFRKHVARTHLAMAACKLSDEDYERVISGMQSAIAEAKGRSEAQPNTRRRVFYLIALPESAIP